MNGEHHNSSCGTVGTLTSRQGRKIILYFCRLIFAVKGFPMILKVNGVPMIVLNCC